MNPVVAPDWLGSKLRDPDVVVLDATLPPVGFVPPVDTRARYAERHIPGAVFFDIDELSDHSTPLPHMLPTAEEFARGMTALGVSDDARIVVTSRKAYFLLRARGGCCVRLARRVFMFWTVA